jgi:restriction endonuclease
MVMSDKRIHAVVSAQEVETRSRQGWRVQEVLKGSRIDTADDGVAFPPNNFQSCPSYGTVTRSHVVEELQFLMVQDETAYVADLRKEIEQLRIEASNTQANLNSAQETLKNTKFALEEAQHRVRTAQEDSAIYRKLSEELTTSNRKMEYDIAKIRVAVGERQMKDILNSPETSK